jgi:hypothetical protein
LADRAKFEHSGAVCAAVLEEYFIFKIVGV